jgi:hypothetical protein
VPLIVNVLVFIVAPLTGEVITGASGAVGSPVSVSLSGVEGGSTSHDETHIPNTSVTANRADNFNSFSIGVTPFGKKKIIG